MVAGLSVVSTVEVLARGTANHPLDFELTGVDQSRARSYPRVVQLVITIEGFKLFLHFMRIEHC